MMTSQARWRPVAVAAAAATMVAVLGATVTELGPWYQALRKPSWQPPDWAFGPAWTLIFVCVAVSASASWSAARSRAGREWLVICFLLNGILNVGWSIMFFRLHAIGWAAIESVVFWLSILALIILTARYSRTAALLLLPYLAWVGFAAALNWAVVTLN